uniref:NADH-ubiquinone oxidoreductase chain 6 n=1 Tax=Alpheus japonicus TaxID=515578 RepID=A0A344KVJ6_9EUCA|nr:NADH dehydrogenase subunit 6 [Alpheus japonicus]AXB37195.1 NADH dehydrogenase subunit 6 [Alpheus japonicus]WPW61523.1 NADH dehydrogenase subunit 6 [Potamalpheops sp. purple zebra]
MTLLMLSSSILMGTSFMFTRLQHPLAMGLTLISQTLLISLASGSYTKFTWLSYILFLIFLGATLVLFIYVASLASNEMFKLSYPMLLLLITPALMSTPLLLKDELLQPLKPISEPSSMSSSQIIMDPTFSLSMIYSPSTSFLTSFVILYLLMTLIVIVKISSCSTGPLRMS